MTKPKISLVAAISENHVLAKDGKIPWHLPTDLQRYRQLIQGHVIIAGRKTFDDSYKDTVNIVVTRNESYVPPIKAVVVHTVADALEQAQSQEFLEKAAYQDEIFVIGGGEIFSETISQADILYLTIIHKQIDGTTFFPDYSSFTKITYQENLQENGYSFTFLNLERGS